MTSRNCRSPHAQGVGYAVNVVKPGCNERDLENADIVKANRAKPIVILGRYLVSRLCQPHREIEHRAVSARQVGGAIVRHQQFAKRRIAGQLPDRGASIQKKQTSQKKG